MKKYIIEVDESELIEYLSKQGIKEIGHYEYTLNSCLNIKAKPYEERPQGEWIKDEQGIYRCPKCFHRCMEFVMGKPKDNFCIECGTKIQKGGEK